MSILETESQQNKEIEATLQTSLGAVTKHFMFFASRIQLQECR